MCHLGASRLEQLIKEELTSDLIVLPNSMLLHVCEPCLQGKQHRAPFPHAADRSSETLGRIFSDVHGPMRVGGHRSNRKWWVTFTDDSTRWMEAYDMCKKSDTFAAFKIFKAQAERYTEKKIKCAHFDKGGEYTSKEFMEFCKSEGIRVEFTNTATPQQNGVAERLNRTIEETITSMLAEAGLLPSFWTYALSMYRHVHNRCPTSALARNLTPFEAFKGRKPRIGHLRMFGCAAYVLVGRDKEKGSLGRSQFGIFIGYPDNHVGWKIYIPKTNKILISRDVVFDETCFSGLSTANIPPPPPLQVFDDLPDLEFDLDTSTTTPRTDGQQTAHTDPLGFDEPLTPLTSDSEDEELTKDRHELVGAERGHTERASRQPRPLPPPREPSQRTRIPTRGPNAGYYDAVQRQADRESPLT